MKISLVLIIIPVMVLIITSGCESGQIDRDTWYTFEQGDTLVYRGTISIDTYYIEKKLNYYEDIDKKDIEKLELSIPQINMNCQSYCDGIRIIRIPNSSSVYFRNCHGSHRNDSDYYPIIDYPIGQHVIKNVYVLPTGELAATNPKDLKKVYYTLIYGVIAYELFTGEVFELDESYFE
jgi:hypothetical protein